MGKALATRTMQTAGEGMQIAVHQTALGWIGVVASAAGIRRIILPRDSKTSVQQELIRAESGIRRSKSSRAYDPDLLHKAVTLLDQYFSGERVSFDLLLDLRYYTSFQQLVWQKASRIPYAETRSYAWVAQRAGNPRAARAVGQAMGRNPVPIIIP